MAAITLGAGGVFPADASLDSGARSVFVPIAPCRLLDTRPAPDNVGTRNVPLGPGVTFTAQVRGANGNCTIPADAIGVSMNVAVVNPTAASFLTVFPSDAPRPLAANLNWVAGQAPTPNAVTAALSANGSVSFYNLSGNVDIAADVNGYYEDHAHDDRYYTKAQLQTDQNDIGVLGRMSKTQLATRAWYQDPARDHTIALGGQPEGITFDGTNVWVAQPNIDAVAKIDRATGKVIATVTDSRIDFPEDVLFDGSSIWVTSRAAGLVLRIDPATNAIVAAVAVPNLPDWLAFDGTAVWVSNGGAPTGVTRIDPATDTAGAHVSLSNLALGLAFDGTSIWAGGLGTALTKVNVSTSVVSDPASTLAGSPLGMAFDGEFLWEAELGGSAALRKIDPVTNSYVGDPIPVSDTVALAFDGSAIWSVDRANGGSLDRIDRYSDEVTHHPVAGLHQFSRLLFDGTSIWVTTLTGVQKITD